MKKVLFIVALVFATLLSNAQEKAQTAYAEIVGQTNLLQTKVTIQIDFGQQRSFWRQGAQKELVDANGNQVQFNSMVDALNYMSNLGWKFEQAYIVTTGNQNVYHWLLSRTIGEGQSASDGLNTKQNFIDSQQKQQVLDSIQ